MGTVLRVQSTVIGNANLSDGTQRITLAPTPNVFDAVFLTDAVTSVVLPVGTQVTIYLSTGTDKPTIDGSGPTMKGLGKGQ